MKAKRHTKIVELVNQYNIETQEELGERLNKAGYPVTQATISRDIRDLKLTKVSADGHQKYVILPSEELEVNEKYVRVLKDGFISMDQAQNILVVKTVSGMAMAVAAALDSLHMSSIVGSIAGDDTVMCAIRDIEEVVETMEQIQKLI